MKCKKCDKTAVFGVKDYDPEYCKDHKLSTHVDVTNKKCKFEDCDKRPSYGKPGSKEPEYCFEHAIDDYVNVVTKKCEHKDCTKNASYGKPGSKTPEYCLQHKPDEYIDVTNKTCVHIVEETGERCSTRPTYGKKGTKEAKYCKSHKPTDYVDVSNKICINANCTTRASYGVNGTTKPEYCASHRPNDYVNVVTKKCIKNDCKKIPVFGKADSTKAEYCAEHKPEDYVNVKDKKCNYIGCTKQPFFGKEGSKKAEYCFEHKPTSYVNVKDKLCNHIDKDGQKCMTRPSYGYAGFPPENCKVHRLPRMVFQPRNKTKEKDFNCKHCSYSIHYSDEYCGSCKRYIELGNITIKQKEKELAIKDILDKEEFKYVYDKQVESGCSLSRPDFRFEIPYGNIILEVDEFQHKRNTYTVECEVTRMQKIYQDCGMPYLLFIRYNPDSYKKGKITDSKRQEYLKKFLSEQLESKVESGLFIVYLFYDYFDQTKPEIKEIDEYTFQQIE